MSPIARAFAAVLTALLALSPLAQAEPAANTVYAKMPAHPALWTVHGKKGTAFLFGSIHILPPQVDWHSPQVEAALAKSDIFVFELAMTGDFQTQMQSAVQKRGMLPEGQHLRDQLPPDLHPAYDKAITGLPLPPAQFDRMRPWLADLTIQTMGLKKDHYSANAGIDVQLMNGIAKGKPVIGLETIDKQLAFIAPTDSKLDLQQFEADLKNSGGQTEAVGPMLDAWMQADLPRLSQLIAADLKGFPHARKALFDDRNKAWVAKIVPLLDQNKTYFITVGAGHLLGPQGVPALLRAKGLKVDGPR